ncbi:MAG: copper chaperone PCu(A)C [Gemmatimonadales bacterium]
MLLCLMALATVDPGGAEPPPVRAAADSLATLALEQAWVEPGEAGTDTRAFLTITSQTAVPVAVGAVATRAARRVRLTGNHQAPRFLAERGGFVIPAHGAIRMQPGGTWLALEELTVDLVPGDSIRLALAMPGALTLWVQAEVRTLRLSAGSRSNSPSRS